MGDENKSNKILYIALFILIVSLSVKLILDYNQKNDLEEVIKGIIQLEEDAKIKNNNIRPAKITIGFGGCTDYVARAIKTFNDVNITSPLIDKFSDNILEINTPEQLNSIFSSFFKEGAAAERYIHNAELFSKFSKVVKNDNDSVSFAGGNAVVMANRLALEGASVLLGARLSESQAKFLHENVTAVSKSSADETEDIHILLEYDINENWGHLTAPRANRFIIHRDVHTPYMKGVEEMSKMIKDFKPDIFVLGGLQMMDDFPYKDQEKTEQINKISKFLSESIPLDLPIHFEMASFADKDLMIMLKNKIIPYSDSLGFNEQELPNLLSILEKDEITTMSSAYPRTSIMLDQMRSVWEYLVDKKTNSAHKLSRLHLHTISYQIIMTDTRSPYWFSSKTAAAKASLVAHRHTCGRYNIDVRISKLFMDDSFAITNRFNNSPRVHFNISDPVSCWQEREVEVCIAPVLVCTKVQRTSGGGDNISSAALLAQLKVLY